MADEKPGSRTGKRRRPPLADSPALHRQALRAAGDYGGFRLDEHDRHLIGYTSAENDPDGERYFRMTRALVVAARRWRKLANERVKPMSQTMARWETLYLVAYSGDEPTQGELARLISVEGPTMVRMLDSLARDGLITREQSTQDRRVTVNRITPEGRAAIDRIMAVTEGLRHEVLDGIDPEKFDIALDVLAQVLRRLDELR